MKSIVNELGKNIEEVKIEEGKIESIKGIKSIEALTLLDQAIKANEYDPRDITKEKIRVILWKKEVTIRFSLRPKGFVLAKVPPGYCERKEPSILVHIRNDGSNYIDPAGVSKTLKLLVDPYHWQKVSKKS